MSITSKTKQNKTSSYSLGYYTTIVYRLYPLAALILSIIEIPYIDLEVKSGQINFQSPVVPGLLFMVFSILFYFIFIFFGILMYLLWRNNTDYYVMAIPLRAIFRINLLILAALVSLLVFVSIVALQSFYVPFQNSKMLIFLVYVFVAISLNVVLVFMYRIGVYFFSPGFRRRLIKLRAGLGLFIVGSEVSKLLEHIGDARKLSLPEYSFLLAEVNASIITSLKIAFPRLLVNGIDKALVNIQLSIFIGSGNELESIGVFFGKLRKIFEGANLKTRFAISKDILELLGSVNETLPVSNKLREENDIIGHWNLQFRDKLEPYIGLISVLLLMLSLAVGILFGPHTLP